MVTENSTAIAQVDIEKLGLGEENVHHKEPINAITRKTRKISALDRTPGRYSAVHFAQTGIWYS